MGQPGSHIPRLLLCVAYLTLNQVSEGSYRQPAYDAWLKVQARGCYIFVWAQGSLSFQFLELRFEASEFRETRAEAFGLHLCLALRTGGNDLELPKLQPGLSLSSVSHRFRHVFPSKDAYLNS